MNETPRILTFYSFKGGVGRSMAVLNVAFALASKRWNVLVLDMDLEAPGLSGFLRRNGEITRCADYDMVDLVRWARDCCRASSETSQPVERAAFPPLSDYAVSVPRDRVFKIAADDFHMGRVDIVPVDEDRDYYGRLTELAASTFDQEALIRMGSLLREWLKSRVFGIEVPEYYGPNAQRSAAYDYVLVDSRTGVTELGGLCIGPLCDQLVVLTSLNDQNVEGTRKFLEEVGILAPRPPANESCAGADAMPTRLDPKPTLIVASPVPAGEIETKQKRLTELEKAIGPVAVKLSYHPQMALWQTIFTRDYPDEYLAHEYRALVDHLLRTSRDQRDFDVAQELEKVRSGPPAARRGAFERALRPGGRDLLRIFLQSTNVDAITEDTDFILLDRVCRILEMTDPVLGTIELPMRANLLAEWSLHTDDPELSRLRYEAAMHCYGEVIENVQSPPWRKAAALVNRGAAYVDRGDVEKAVNDYNAVLEMPDAPAEQKANALALRGWARYKAARLSDAIDDENKAVALDGTNRIARANLALCVMVAGRTDEALVAYDAALRIANSKYLDEMTKDIREAVEKHGALPGAEEALARIAARRKELDA